MSNFDVAGFRHCCTRQAGYVHDWPPAVSYYSQMIFSRFAELISITLCNFERNLHCPRSWIELLLSHCT